MTTTQRDPKQPAPGAPANHGASQSTSGRQLPAAGELVDRIELSLEEILLLEHHRWRAIRNEAEVKNINVSELRLMGRLHVLARKIQARAGLVGRSNG